jgi:SAM-dependent methyltransferase
VNSRKSPATYTGSLSKVFRLRLLSVLESLHLLIPLRDFYNWSSYALNFSMRRKNAGYRRRGAPDGLPVPTPKLMHLVSGRYNLEGLYTNGKLGAECIREILGKNKLRIEEFSSILDFGCGCGRILRFWQDLKNTKVYGTDYNPELIQWCKESLRFAEFSVNRLDQRMDYIDEQFDFIYAVSVFTHLGEQLQSFWMNELKRILRLEGYMYITVLGIKNLDKLSLIEKNEFSQGKIILENSGFSGTNICRVFHPEQYFRKNMTHGMKVVDFIPGGARDAENQDVFLLKKVQ